jgi:predicted transcriptional regulator
MPPKVMLERIERWHERTAMADLCIRLVQSIGRDYFPGARTCDAFEMLVILNAMFEMHTAGRFATASALARSTGISRSTVQRRIGKLTKLGAIERNGTRFLLSVSYLNKPGILEGFKRRVDVVKDAPKKLDWTSRLT